MKGRMTASPIAPPASISSFLPSSPGRCPGLRNSTLSGSFNSTSLLCGPQIDRISCYPVRSVRNSIHRLALPNLSFFENATGRMPP